MLLNELLGVKRFHNVTKRQLEKILGRQGIELIGSGKYGEVWTHPSWDYVVKIFQDPYYLSFVNLALKHPNRHFPKFQKKPLNVHLFHRRRKDEGNRATLVKIEKLQNINDKELIDFLITNLEDAAHVLSRAQPPWSKGTKYNKDSPMKALKMPDGSYAQNITWREVFTKLPWFKTLCGAYLLIMNSDTIGAFDLHKNSFMQRSDGTIVMIDPLWAGESPQARYERGRDAESVYWADEEPANVRGPDYIHKKKEKERQERERERREKEENERYQYWLKNGKWPQPEDDDIPF